MLVSLTNVRYHADQITTASSIDTLNAIKKKTLKYLLYLIHHICLNELDIGPYRSFFKLTPPLRSEIDRVATTGLKDGTIDIIGSFHTPQDEEKRLPYEVAASGAIGVQTLLSSALRLFHDKTFDLLSLFRFLSLNPADVLGMPFGRIKVGSPADLVIFDPDEPFVLNRFKLKSKSKNTPFDEQLLQGRVLKTFIDGKEVFESVY